MQQAGLCIFQLWMQTVSPFLGARPPHFVQTLLKIPPLAENMQQIGFQS